jgi:hypothetical protein
MWKNATLSGILLSQGMIMTSLNKTLTGYSCGESFARLTVYTFLALVLSSIEADSGICDCLLWTHACAGITGYISPMALVLGIKSILGTRAGKRGEIYIRPPVLILIVLIAAFITDLGLSFEASKWWTILLSSVFISLHIGLSHFAQRAEMSRSTSFTDVSTSTDESEDETVVVLSSFQTDKTVIEASETETEPVAELTKLDATDLSPAGATTPSTVSDLTCVIGGVPSHPPEEWYYIDLTGKCQGPFAPSLMNQWLSAGYLDLNLLVSSNPLDEFQTIRSLGQDSF